MIDLAENYDKGPTQAKVLAKRQDISVKYLEQLIIPLKKGGYIDSRRGTKGGHLIAKSPDQITVGEIVKLMEGGEIVDCLEAPFECERNKKCHVRRIWQEASDSFYGKLNSITLKQVIDQE